MGLYRCMWPNGEVSFVMAGDKDDAVILLDEFGEAGREMLSKIENGDFMVTFAPTHDEETEGVSAPSSRREYDWVLSETGDRTTGEDGPLDWNLAEECWAARSALDEDEDEEEESKS